MAALSSLLLKEGGLTWDSCLSQSKDFGEYDYSDAVARLFQRGKQGIADPELRECVEACTVDSKPVKRISDCIRHVLFVLFFFDRDDARVLSLIERRFGLVEQIGAIKRKFHLPLHRPDREQEVMAYSAMWYHKCGLPSELGPIVYRCLWFPLAYEIESMVMKKAKSEE